MGYSANAELIYGVPIVSHDDEGEPTQFWNDDEGDWREFDGLKIEPYGHYEDPDCDRAILTTDAIPSHSGGCRTPGSVGRFDFDVEAYFPEAEDDFIQRLVSLDEPLANKRGWRLVASYG